MAIRIKRVGAGRYEYGPYEIVNTRRGVWELIIKGDGTPRSSSPVDVYRTYAEAKADAVADQGGAIQWPRAST